MHGMKTGMVMKLNRHNNDKKQMSLSCHDSNGIHRRSVIEVMHGMKTGLVMKLNRTGEDP